MSSASDQNQQALKGAVVPAFLKYLALAVLGLIAMTSAMLVDGLFIGNYVGVTALAAVNLIIPISTLLFGVGMMLSIGGSVRAGKYLGEDDKPAASAIFSKTLVCMALYGTVAISLALAFEEALFTGLGASRELLPAMSEYYRIIMPFLLAQLIVLALYYFIRMDGYPNLVATALTIGAVVNILLDYLFIGRFGWGLTGAAFATGISQALPLPVMMIYFLKPGRRLRFAVRQHNWKEVFQAAFNGVSEFINEVSGGIVLLILNWMLLRRIGVHGVAAMTVVSYTMLLGYMMFFAVSDTVQVMISQNFGARNAARMAAFLKTAAGAIAMLNAIFITVLLAASEPIIRLFVDDRDSAATVALATEFVTYIWPLFLFVSVNVLLSGYLTAIHRPLQSVAVALCRSLILPTAFLALAYLLLSDQRFVVALPVAEATASVLALALFLRHLPARVAKE